MLGAEDVRRLGEGRWLVPVLARLQEQRGARFAELVGGLGIARESLARTLAYAMQSGWVMRNPGHGHPLRPEYILTEAGEAVAAACLRMMAARARLGICPEGMPRWSLPILHRLDGGWARFTALRLDLAPVTTRALSLSLKQMAATRLITRQVEQGFPPSTLYGLAPPGRELMGCLRSG